MSVKEYFLKFHQLLRYASILVDNMRDRMRKFTSGLNQDMTFGEQDLFFIKDMEISRLLFICNKWRMKIGNKRSLEKGKVRSSEILNKVVGNNKVVGMVMSG